MDLSPEVEAAGSSPLFQHAESGDPASGSSVPRETLETPLFASTRWDPPPRMRRGLDATKAIRITLELSSSALLIWILAPEELKYDLRKYLRWLPYAARYAAWWLKQEGW